MWNCIVIYKDTEKILKYWITLKHAVCIETYVYVLIYVVNIC